MFTCEDYLKLEDNQDYEVIGGKLILVPKPMPYHQEIVGRLITELNIFFCGKTFWERYIPTWTWFLGVRLFLPI
jgi:Uma2 family endonuclease